MLCHPCTQLSTYFCHLYHQCYAIHPYVIVYGHLSCGSTITLFFLIRWEMTWIGFFVYIDFPEAAFCMLCWQNQIGLLWTDDVAWSCSLHAWLESKKNCVADFAWFLWRFTLVSIAAKLGLSLWKAVMKDPSMPLGFFVFRPFQNWRIFIDLFVLFNLHQDPISDVLLSCAFI